MNGYSVRVDHGASRSCNALCELACVSTVVPFAC
jgi:hypothetical protein